MKVGQSNEENQHTKRCIKENSKKPPVVSNVLGALAAAKQKSVKPVFGSENDASEPIVGFSETLSRAHLQSGDDQASSCQSVKDGSLVKLLCRRISPPLPAKHALVLS